MSVRNPKNNDLSQIEGLSGLRLCLNAPGVRAVAGTGGGYVGSSTILAPLDGESFSNILFLSLALDASVSRSRSESANVHRLLSVDPLSGLSGLLVDIWITSCSLSIPPLLHGNNGEALLHIVMSTQEVLQRDPPAPDRLGPVNPLRWLRSLRTLRVLEVCSSFLHDWQVRIQIRSWRMIELT